MTSHQDTTPAPEEVSEERSRFVLVSSSDEFSVPCAEEKYKEEHHQTARENVPKEVVHNAGTNLNEEASPNLASDHELIDLRLPPPLLPQRLPAFENRVQRSEITAARVQQPVSYQSSDATACPELGTSDSHASETSFIPIAVTEDAATGRQPTGIAGIQPENTSGLSYEILPSTSNRLHRQAFEYRVVKYGVSEELQQIAWDFVWPDLQQGGIILKYKSDDLKIINDCYFETEQFTFGRLLGAGDQGECMLARDVTTNYEFCVKNINCSNYRPDEVIFMTHLLGEKGFVQIYGAVKKNSEIFILMQLLRGKTMTAWIDSSKYCTCVTKLRVFELLLERVRVLSTHGILHEDLTGNNVMIVTGPQGQPEPCLIDFSHARKAPVPPGEEAVGTWTHFSAEKQMEEGYSHKSDVFAATSTFMHSLMGKVVFPNDPCVQSLPQCIAEIVESGWNDDPDERSTAEDLQCQVRRVLDSRELERQGLRDDEDVSATTNVQLLTEEEVSTGAPIEQPKDDDDEL